MIQSCRVPTWLRLAANALSVDPVAIELHNRLNGALERGDVMEGLRLMRELKRNFESVGTLRTILTIEVQHA